MGGLCGKAEPTSGTPTKESPPASPKTEKAAQPPPPEPKNETPRQIDKSESMSASQSKQGGMVDELQEEEVEIRVEPIEDFYEITRVIGEGGFSTVYEGKKKETGEKFAVKKIKKADLEVEEDNMKLLFREIQIMKNLTHPNILKLFEVFEDEEHYSLVLELVEGQELFEKIVSRSHYSEKDASNVIRQIVSAVGYLHSQGIAHRDLKPENILASMTEDGREVVKLADFGFSNQGDKFLTGLGSLGYVAPEVLEEKPYDKSCDMWSVGVILYILLAGFPPFTGETPPDLCKNTINGNYDFDDPIWDEVSDDAKDIIKNLLKVDPSQRLTAEEFCARPWVQGDIKEVEKADVGWL